MVEKRNGFSFLVLFVMLAMLFGVLWPLSSVRGDDKEEKKNLPPRAISIAPEYTAVVVPKGEDVSIDVDVSNGGRQDEYIDLKLTSAPKGWKARIKTYSYEVKGVFVKSDSSKSLTFRAEPEEGTGPGKYNFSMLAQTHDGKLTSSADVVIEVVGKQKETKAKGVSITTSYPVLRGPTDAKFEFSLEVKSRLDKDTVFNLSAEGPKDWEINFKPAYEEKYFSSLRIKANQSETMAVEVKPSILAEPGKYPIKVRVKSDKAQGEADLMVVLTGTYKIDAGTPNGLLSLDAYQGKEANLSFYVKNSGSAMQDNIRFLSVKPENWKVKFKPEKIENLSPGDIKQVEMTITPSEQALVGDYSVNVSIQGQKASKNLEFRVTVKASTAWGWVGIGIIVLVIAGLVALFIRMGRR
ncbi:MAG: hypothetical protein JRI79_12725 [Deltaproteobacteria bacterium]|nr:hypothetical protein [Deltaproteobacteria bacterium]MBW1978814.1 hypothetical protein [Deltaproteobacteria bacterium]MBW2044800.1 hypothetical protein [Deltaproteobacteria bacterium]